MTNPRPHCQGGAGEKTEPTSTRSGFGSRSGFGFGNFYSSKLLCIIFTSIVVLGLGCSAFRFSSKPGGVSELLDSVVVPDATAVQVSAPTRG